jgi:bifunctional DNase/RNase
MTQCSNPGCSKDADGLVSVLVHHDGQASETAFCKDHVHDSGIDYILRDPRHAEAQIGSEAYEVCKLHRLIFLYGVQKYFVVLKGIDTESVFVIQTGYVEACSIYGAINRPPHPTPLTYQLFADIVRTLDGTILEAVFHGYDKVRQTYESHLALRRGLELLTIECRGSDAIGISFLARTPIRVKSVFLGHPGRHS